MDNMNENPAIDARTEAAVQEAALLVKNARYLIAFTGAGISVESGIPPFRGENGLWSKYDPQILDIDYFHRRPEDAWKVIKEIFYDYFGKAEPNGAHRTLALLERQGLLKTLITQNIDDLHFKAGSRNIVEYHGNSRNLFCRNCRKTFSVSRDIFEAMPPRCSCGTVLKPDFVFFGEGIPLKAVADSEHAVKKTDVMILIGTTGEVYPAAALPPEAKRRGAKIIEINPVPSNYTSEITDIFIGMRAVRAMDLLYARIAGS